jgi:hypothetical protein
MVSTHKKKPLAEINFFDWEASAKNFLLRIKRMDSHKEMEFF